MFKKLIVSLMTLGLFIAFSLTVGASPDPQAMSKRMPFGIRMAERNLVSGHMLLKLKDKIGLSDKQVKQIEKLGVAFREAEIKQKSALEIQELKFKTHLKQEKVNRSTIEKLIREIGEARTNMQINRLNHLLDLKELLTLEQIKKIEEIKKEFRRNMWKRARDKRSGFRGHR